jgi:hypothetical protein
MTALEFANSHEHVIVRIAGNGCPAGLDIALLAETELPFDLEAVEGKIDANGDFEATNLAVGSGADGWKFTDHNCNTIYGIWLRSDAEVWQREFDESLGA